MVRAFLLAAALALACLLVRAVRMDLAADDIDPVSRVTASDEAMYAHSAIAMARLGDWLTPMFMNRFALAKPPLLLWASGISARLLGITRFSLRLPVALACALAVGLVFLWAAEVRSWQAGALSALLLVSNHLWHVMGATCMTDGLLAAFFTAALYCLFADPWLESRRALWGFAAAVAAAILTKGIAGILPLGMLALYCLAAPPKQRPAPARALLAAGISLALAAPWFLYQAVAHGHWFLAEQLGGAILGFAPNASPSVPTANPASFYLPRLAALDPVLLACALTAIPAFIRELRRKSAAATMLLCWMAVPLAAAMLWHSRNAAYLLPLIPPFAILAASFGPFSADRSARWMLVLAAAAFAAKISFPAAPWGLSFAPARPPQTAALLSEYCERRRAHELIVVGMDDHLYGVALPLPRLRYCLVGGAPPPPNALPLLEMGVTLTAAQFNGIDVWVNVFRRRLAEWGLYSIESVGSLILADTPAELAEIIQTHPVSDFLIPDSLAPAVNQAAQASHQVVPRPGHLLLLAREGRPRRDVPGWSCRL